MSLTSRTKPISVWFYSFFLFRDLKNVEKKMLSLPLMAMLFVVLSGHLCQKSLWRLFRDINTVNALCITTVQKCNRRTEIQFNTKLNAGIKHANDWLIKSILNYFSFYGNSWVAKNISCQCLFLKSITEKVLFSMSWHQS